MAKSMAVKKCDLDRVHHLNMTTKRFAREYEGVKPVIIEGLVGDKWSASSAGRWAQPSLKDSFGLSPIHVRFSRIQRVTRHLKRLIATSLS